MAMDQHLDTISITVLKVGRSPTHTVHIGPRKHADTTGRVEGRFERMQVQPMLRLQQPILRVARTFHSMHGFTKVVQVAEKHPIQVRIFNSSTRLQADNGQHSIPSKAVVHKPVISNIPPSYQQQRFIQPLSSESNRPLEAEHAVIIGSLTTSR